MLTPLRKWLDACPRGAVHRLHIETGIPLRRLHRSIAGERALLLHEAIAISRATNGEVRLEDLAIAEAK